MDEVHQSTNIIYTIAVIAGPILLAIVLAWGTMNYRSRRRRGSRGEFENAPTPTGKEGGNVRPSPTVNQHR